jgi:hypothetical protein
MRRLQVAFLFAARLSAAGDPIPGALAFFSAEEIRTLPRIVIVIVRPERVVADAEGYTVDQYPVIYIAAWSAAYRAAAAGDREAIMKLAGVIAHERMHVEHGPAERPAYEAEIFMLRRCGASSALIDGVRRAMEVAVSGARRGLPPSARRGR